MSADGHRPVLLAEVLAIFADLLPTGWFVDATIGAAGHAEAVLEAHSGLRLLGIDRDPQALAIAATRLGRFGNRIVLVERRFDELAAVAEEVGARPIVGVLADLGVSSMQLDRAERGFSFRREGPLDMRMGRAGRTAADIVARAPVNELTRIFRDFGEERMSAKLARRIVSERSRTPIATTRQLARIVAGVKGRREKIDPATRVFQALRIEVNEELASLERFLKEAVERLCVRGCIAVISYHSLEDRIVKRAFARDSGGCLCPPGLPVCVCGGRRILRVLTRRPIRPSLEEVRRNPRARSAKLRAAEKTEEAERT
jgi:16S rRNA (cytosine1402-N4)-methyltransferase